MFESLRSEAVISWLILPVLELEGEMQDKFRQRDGLNFFFFFFQLLSFYWAASPRDRSPLVLSSQWRDLVSGFIPKVNFP